MVPGPTSDITGLLLAWREGDPSALEHLVPLVDRELRAIARGYLARESGDAELQTTAIINDVYVRLIDSGKVNCQDRSHFYAVCARVMRRVLVDRARARKAVKRGSGADHEPIRETSLVLRERMTDILSIHEALDRLSRMDKRKGKIVEMRFFGGMSVEETAMALQVSQETVLRDWRLARIWLMRILSSGPGKDADGA